MQWGTTFVDYGGLQGLGAPTQDWNYLKGLLLIGANDPYGRPGGPVEFAKQLAYAMLPDDSRGTGFNIPPALIAQRDAVNAGNYIAAYGATWPQILDAAMQAAQGNTGPWSALVLPDVPLASAFGGKASYGGYLPAGSPGTIPTGTGTGSSNGSNGGYNPPTNTGGTPPLNTGGSNNGSYSNPSSGEDNMPLMLLLAAAGVVLFMVTQNK